MLTLVCSSPRNPKVLAFSQIVSKELFKLQFKVLRFNQRPLGLINSDGGGGAGWRKWAGLAEQAECFSNGNDSRDLSKHRWKKSNTELVGSRLQTQ